MDRRLELHEKFCELLGSRYAYFQPPENLKMNYPCIKYSRSGIDQRYADNLLYKNMDRYEVIVVDFDPDSKISTYILNTFPMCRFDRNYISDNLHHTVFTLYY